MTANSLRPSAPVQSAGSTLDSTAREVLAGYHSRYWPQAPQQISSIQETHASQPPQGFSGASVWRVETRSSPCCLRATPAETCNLSRLKGLRSLLAHVAAEGLIEVSVPIRRADGATFVVADGRVWQLEPWCQGRADYWQRPSDPRLRNASICLARWHRAAAGFRCQPDEHLWFFVCAAAPSPGLRERVEQLESWGDHRLDETRRALSADDWAEFRQLGQRLLETFRRVAPAIGQQLRLGAQVQVPLQPCLRDIWHDHVLFTGDKVTGLIDPHSCRSDCVATDLARLLGSLAGEDRRQWEVALAAYEQVRPLSFDERALVELFDRSAVALSGLTWLDWRYRQHRNFPEPQRVVSRLEAIVARLETLADRGA